MLYRDTKCSKIRSGFDENVPDTSFLSRQQTCTSRKDENDTLQRFKILAIILSLTFIPLFILSSLPFTEYNQDYCRRKILIQRYEKQMVGVQLT